MWVIAPGKMGPIAKSDPHLYCLRLPGQHRSANVPFQLFKRVRWISQCRWLPKRTKSDARNACRLWAPRTCEKVIEAEKKACPKAIGASDGRDYHSKAVAIEALAKQQDRRNMPSKVRPRKKHQRYLWL